MGIFKKGILVVNAEKKKRQNKYLEICKSKCLCITLHVYIHF